jgi:hypothetical protein
MRGSGPSVGPPELKRLLFGFSGMAGALDDALADELADELPDELTDELAESLDDPLALEAAVAGSLFDAEPPLEPHCSMVIVHVALAARRISR